MRQQEKTQDRREYNFVVEGLAVQLQKRRIDFDVITTSVNSNTKFHFLIMSFTDKNIHLIKSTSLIII